MADTKTTKAKKPADKVALFSEKILHIENKQLNIGFNIVSADQAEKWLVHPSVRVADPEEVARAFGK